MTGNNPVFIHRDLPFLERLTLESSGNIKTSSSLRDALRWIQDPNQPISAIFIHPDDPDYSVFQFLEQTWNVRPVTPVFLLEKTLSKNADESSRIIEKIAVSGIHCDEQSYQTIMEKAGINPIPTPIARRKKSSITDNSPGYTTVPVTDFSCHDHFPFDVYFRVEDSSMRIFAKKGARIDSSQITQLATKLDFLYVRNDIHQDRSRILQETCENMLENPDFPDDWKTAEVLARSKNLLSKIRNSEMNNPMVALARTLLDDLQKLITNLKLETGSISRLIHRSLSNDRAVYCTTLSILICQQLKFEKKSTLEILGLAAILQDISLYQTPSGDLSNRPLSELNLEETKYHHRHPILSSDILAHQTNIPQVTLQVIRQHHERKDRSGYPNRTGGVQLHPLAEILSLINSCFEISHQYEDQKDALFAMESEVFVHFSESSVNALKKIHSRL